MKTIHQKIKAYKYIDRKNGLYTTVFANLLLFLCITFASTLSFNTHAMISMISAMVIFMLISVYDWKSPSINLFVTGGYLGFFLWEFFTLGTAGVSISYQMAEYQVSKGIMFDLMVWTLPSMYMGIRLLAVIPLILMTHNSWKS
ncbi:hypothetical protein [Kordia sp.]|uniref:hypothetical protein n=1 Tax=Kordia sp. TaxID=1965332 RepID=UPI0025C008D1|nr:hypothetical protein [Kordia sp.]MCH2083136.1 hypothetical protein [Saprospiraceae bacterium]MCH2193313.1 hypothetical protein [Kordia sp.]